MFKNRQGPIAVHMKLFFHEATCEFKRRDALNYASISGVGKTPASPPRLQAVWFPLTSPDCCNFLFSRISRSCIKMLWTNLKCCSFVTILLANCVTFLWTSFQFCPFITILLTTFVHASRSSGRIFNFVHSSQSSWPLLFMHRGALNEFLMTDEIDASTKHHPTAFITTCRPNYTFSCAVEVVPAQDTRFAHRSDSPVLTFWELEFFLNEHGVAPTSLQQPNVGLFPIRAGGPSRLLRLRQI